MKSVTIEEIEKVDADSLIILDIRKTEDYKRNTIPHAINIPMEKLKDAIPELEKNKTVCVLCYTGEQSWEIVEKVYESRAGI